MQSVRNNMAINAYKQTNFTNIISDENLKPKIDVNNCSEFELTELPGISIVLAKRIIKRREEIGGFKRTEDFFEFLQLKEHLVKQIMTLVKAEKMCGKVIKNYNKERTIDF